MEENIKLLKRKFNEIRKLELTKTLRKGTTGIGYTFETLLGKEEDNSYLPDFNGIEIKTKLGYSSSPLTLFCMVPKKQNNYCIKHILNTYGYPDKEAINHGFKRLKGNVYYKQNNIIASKYVFKLKIDMINKKVRLFILDRYFNIIENDIFWDFEDLEQRLFAKLSYLAIIKGFPYKRNNNTFYKYTNLDVYKLKNFDIFLKLIENDKIFVVFNIDMIKSEKQFGKINDRGTAFRINIRDIEQLFEKVG